MLTRETMRGLYALPPTPFTGTGEFDEDSFRTNCRALIEVGVDAITTSGTCGEFHSMPWEMLQEVIRALVDECKGKVPAIAGCSGVHTEDAIKRTRFAMEQGADAVMNVSPYYINLTERELVGFWTDLSEACPDIGLIVYNFHGVQLHRVPVFKELARLPNMCGSKEAHYDYGLLMELLRASDLAHLHATELIWFVSSMQMGSKGIYSMSASTFPRYMVKLYRACTEKRWDEAKRMEWRLKDAHESMAHHPCLEGYHGIVMYKAMCTACSGLNWGKSRKPFISISDEHQAELTEFARRECADLMNP